MKEKTSIMLLVQEIKNLENSQGFISANETEKRKRKDKLYQMIGEEIFRNYRSEVDRYFYNLTNPKSI